MRDRPVEWVWERTDDEIEALYRRAAGRTFPWMLLVASLGVPLLAVAGVFATLPPYQAQNPVNLALAAGIVLFFVLNALPGLLVRRRARELRRLLEARGIGIERTLRIRWEPWGLVLRNEGGIASLAWPTLSSARGRGWWEVRHRGRPWLDLPDRSPVPELLTAPETPTELPDLPEGSVSWTYGLPERDTWTRANGTGTPRSFVIWSLVLLSVAGAAGLAAMRSAGWPKLWLVLLVAFLVLSRGLVFARWWRSARVLRLGTTYASHVGRAGVLSGSDGLRTFTPWGSVTGWWPRDAFVFLSTTGGVWHMIPKHAVPDEAESWFEAARTARREARRRPVPPMEPGRDNPFQPPSV